MPTHHRVETKKKRIMQNTTTKHRYNNNRLHIYRGSTGISRKYFIVEDSEIKYIKRFIDEYTALSSRDRAKIDKMRHAHSLRTCLYYCKVWNITTSNITERQELQRGANICIDHIVPISIGYSKGWTPTKQA